MFRTPTWSLLTVPVLVAAILTTAMADPAAASVPGRETVSRSTSSTSDSKSVEVSCTGDRWLLSAGVDVEGDGRPFVIVDELVPGLSTVTAHAHEFEYGTSASWILRVWAICQNPAGSHRTPSSTTASNSDNKGATASCPDGLVVSGVGWVIEGEPGQILIESAVPTAGSVTVNAYEVDAGGSGEYLGNWSVQGYATCVTRPVGYEIVTATSTSTSDEKLGHADCDTGDVEIGAGFLAPGPRGRINTVALLPGFDTALTYAHEVVATTNTWSLNSYAICALR